MKNENPFVVEIPSFKNEKEAFKQMKADKAMRAASFPNTWFYEKTLKREVVESITRKAIFLLDLPNTREAYYRKKNPEYGWHSQISCWIGIKAYLNGSRNWDVCMGVNNPFLIGMAEII